jgi:hypothetical protein
MVGITFVDNPEDLEQVDHINLHRDDPDFLNLRWCNPSGQTAHQRRKKEFRFPRGVRKERTGPHFMVQVWKNGKVFTRHGFKTIADAKAVAIRMRRELHGDFAMDV